MDFIFRGIAYFFDHIIFSMVPYFAPISNYIIMFLTLASIIYWTMEMLRTKINKINLKKY